METQAQLQPSTPTMPHSTTTSGSHGDPDLTQTLTPIKLSLNYTALGSHGNPGQTPTLDSNHISLTATTQADIKTQAISYP